MGKTTFQDLTRTRDLRFGIFLAEFVTPGIGRILKATGLDFVFVDMEHAALSYETVKQVLRNLHDAGLASMVRPASQHYHDISRAVDVGAEGVMPPMLSTGSQAKHLVSSIKYPPVGTRGVALGIAHDDYGPGTVAEKFASANAKTSGVALIETKDAIDNIDDIAKVDGLDCLWIGHFDLTCSLGIPGQFDHKSFQDSTKKVIKAAKKHKKALGRLAGNEEEAAALIDQGFHLICYGSDIGLLQGAISGGITRLRERAGQG
jgi:2-keto-3-deoxy-L-rhamnonate aldolase RhmA